MARTSAPSPALRKRQEALEELARQLGVRVQYEPMTGRVHGAGGLCKVHGEYRVIVDRRLPPRERIGVLARALSRFDLSELEVPAEVEALVCPVGPPAREASSEPAEHPG